MVVGAGTWNNNVLYLGMSSNKLMVEKWFKIATNGDVNLDSYHFDNNHTTTQINVVTNVTATINVLITVTKNSTLS